MRWPIFVRPEVVELIRLMEARPEDWRLGASDDTTLIHSGNMLVIDEEGLRLPAIIRFNWRERLEIRKQFLKHRERRLLEYLNDLCSTETKIPLAN